MAIFLLIITKPCSKRLYAAGLLLVFIGEILRTWSAGHLHKTAQLSTTGPYAMVRNPLYAGSFLIASGFGIIATNTAYWPRTAMLWIILIAGFIAVYKMQVSAEENHLAGIFGKDYEDYKKNVPQYLPDIFKLPAAVKTSSFSFERFKKNRELTTLLGIVSAAVIFGVKLKYGI